MCNFTYNITYYTLLYVISYFLHNLSFTNAISLVSLPFSSKITRFSVTMCRCAACINIIATSLPSCASLSEVIRITSNDTVRWYALSSLYFSCFFFPYSQPLAFIMSSLFSNSYTNEASSYSLYSLLNLYGYVGIKVGMSYN